MSGKPPSAFDVGDPAAPSSGAHGSQPPSGRSRWMAALLIVALVAAGGYVMTGFVRAPSIPPEGTIWFGMSFDPDTFEIRERLTSVGPEDSFVMVARLTRPLLGSRLVIR